VAAVASIRMAVVAATVVTCMAAVVGGTSARWRGQDPLVVLQRVGVAAVGRVRV
jgi:anti-sigma-K factor RskA